MPWADVGDEVRVDIPDKTDPDFESYHGRTGTVQRIVRDDAERLTGDERDSTVYRVEFPDGDVQDFRWRDLRPTADRDR